MKHKFNNFLSRGVIFETTKIQILINQIDFWSIAAFGKGIALPDLKWGQTLATTLDIKT
jgi:hypothetical protein